MPFIFDPGSPGATFLDLQTELYARGYDHLNQDAAGRTRAKRMINQAYQEVSLEELWPFRLATTTGAAPLSITDLDQVLTVVNTADNNRELYEATEYELTVYDLTEAGTPLMYYRDSLFVRTFPLGGTLSVRHYIVPAALVADTDTTIVPLRYADVIVDGAVRRAAKDRDNPDAVSLARAEQERGLQLMRRQLMVAPTHFIMLPGGSGDG